MIAVLATLFGLSVSLGFGAEQKLRPVQPGDRFEIGAGRRADDGVACDSKGLGVDTKHRLSIFAWSPERAVIIHGEPGQTRDLGLQSDNAPWALWLFLGAASTGEQQRHGNRRPRGHDQRTASSTAAAPRPPAAQIPSNAVSLPLFASSFATVVTMRAPVAPNG